MWKVVLANGEIIEQDIEDLGCWRKLSQRCHKEEIKIKQLFYNGEEIDPKGDAYFIIYDILAPFRGKQSLKIGLGSIRESRNKCRIRWFPLVGYNKNIKAYNEVIRGVPEPYQEISITKQKF
jgi:hypothetical protein